jgi:hypothetical protein
MTIALNIHHTKIPSQKIQEVRFLNKPLHKAVAFFILLGSGNSNISHSHKKGPRRGGTLLQTIAKWLILFIEHRRLAYGAHYASRRMERYCAYRR